MCGARWADVVWSAPRHTAVTALRREGHRNARDARTANTWYPARGNASTLAALDTTRWDPVPRGANVRSAKTAVCRVSTGPHVRSAMDTRSCTMATASTYALWGRSRRET